MARKIKALYFNGHDLPHGYYHREHRSSKGRSPLRPDSLYKLKKQKLKEQDIE